MRRKHYRSSSLEEWLVSSSRTDKQDSEKLEDVVIIQWFWEFYVTKWWSWVSPCQWCSWTTPRLLIPFSISSWILDTVLKRRWSFRSIFRVIYIFKSASAFTSVKGADNKQVRCGSFQISRGVLQGDAISPIFFILTLCIYAYCMHLRCTVCIVLFVGINNSLTRDRKTWRVMSRKIKLLDGPDSSTLFSVLLYFPLFRRDQFQPALGHSCGSFDFWSLFFAHLFTMHYWFERI